jgi:hypothetical protein
MTGRRKLASSIFADFPDNIDAMFQIPDTELVYAVKGPNFFKYSLDTELKTFSLVEEEFDASETVPLLRDGVDGIVFIENSGNSPVFAGIKGVKFFLFKFSPDTESFAAVSNRFDYLDSDESPFYIKEKDGDKVVERGLKVRQ